MIHRCPVCNGDEHSTIWHSRSPLLPITRARAAGYSDLFAEIDIVLCHRCGYGFNRTTTPAITDRMYGDVALTNIPVDPSMHLRLETLVHWLPRDAMAGGHVLEIGAGGGHLARLIADIAKQVTVVEPCRALTRALVPESNIELVHDMFPGRTRLPKANVVLARQVLEHVVDPVAFMQAIAEALTDDGYAYIEVPNAEYIERYGALFDLHAQHIQYFRPEHVIELGRRAGLVALQSRFIKEAHDFGILFHRSDGAQHGNASWVGGGQERAGRWKDRLSNRADELSRLDLRRFGRVSLYGATMHGTVFLNLLPEADDLPIATVIDDNAAYAGYGLYTEKRFIGVSESKSALSHTDLLVITAYLHDVAIGRKARQLGYDGPIFTTRVAPSGVELQTIDRVFQSVEGAPYSA